MLNFKLPLVIVKKDYGQLGNRLHTHTNVLAWCIKNNLSFLNLSFRDYTKAFPESINVSAKSNLHSYILIKLIYKCSIFYNFLNRLCLSNKNLEKISSFVHIIDCQNEEILNEQTLDQHLDQKRSSILLLIRAWDIRCPEAIYANVSKLKVILSPTDLIIKKVAVIKKSLSQYDFIIGVHVRRGDYETWLNGKYFFSWKQYSNWVIELESLLIEKGKKPAFIICSDEKIPSSSFSNKSTICSQSDALTDLFTLSSCNIIIGPPSSFSSWASFYGDTKKINLFSEIKLKDAYK